MSSNSINLKSIISDVLIDEVSDIVDKHKYLSFGVISQGIEFLGACIDTEKETEIHDRGQSRCRFNLAIEELFPDKYQDKDLYVFLRCSMVHVLIPKKEIELIQRTEVGKFGQHLTMAMIRDEERLILVAEDFFEDFRNACNKVIEWIEEDQSKINPKIIGMQLSNKANN